jgi:hypothetical protein
MKRTANERRWAFTPHPDPANFAIGTVKRGRTAFVVGVLPKRTVTNRVRTVALEVRFAKPDDLANACGVLCTPQGKAIACSCPAQLSGRLKCEHMKAVPALVAEGVLECRPAR